MTVNTPFSHPTRQAPAAIVFLLGDNFRILVKQLWVIILVVLFNPKRNLFDGFTMVFVALTVLGAIGSVISYFRYYFYIRQGELILEKGILRKIKINVPLDRVQSVNLKRGILHQALDVVEIEIETAGSKQKEFHLHAIGKNQALEFREYVMGQKTRSSVEANVAPETSGFGVEKGELMEQSPVYENHGEVMEPSGKFASNSNYEKPKPNELIFNLSPVDLLKIGVSQNHLRTAGIMLAFFIGFFDDLEQALGFDLAEEVEELLGMEQAINFGYYILMALPVFLIVSFLLTLFNTVLKYFNLHFWRTERGFKIESGLFTREEFSVNLRKIQYLMWKSNPLKRYFGLVSVAMPQAASVQVGRSNTGSLPGCRAENLDAIRQTWFPEESEQLMNDHGINNRIIYRQMIVSGFIPVGILMALTWSWLQSGILIWLFWLPFAYLISKKYHQNWLWQVSEDCIRISWGVFNHRTVLMQWYKVQAIGLRSNWFLDRKGLTHVDIFTAAGAVSIPFVPLEKALALQDVVLYKMETDSRSWM